MRRPYSLISLVLGVLLASAAVAVFRLASKPADLLVADSADLLNDDDEVTIERYHAFLLLDHDIDYRVVTSAEGEDINLAAVEKFEELADTIRSTTGRGLLLIVDSTSNLVRLEVGFALEGVLPDGFVAYIEQRQMVPFFEQNRIADGILATSELIIGRVQDAAANLAFDESQMIAGSGGAGATAEARLGAGPSALDRRPDENVGAGRSPAETLRQYFSAMDARNDNPNLEIYTQATRRMMQNWVMTPAQMDNLVGTYRGCRQEPTRFSDDGRLAVIRYPASERSCAPFFFESDGENWALDLTMMQSAIRFGRSNAWRFDPAVSHPYAFGFDDWQFDRKGFPN